VVASQIPLLANADIIGETGWAAVTHFGRRLCIAIAETMLIWVEDKSSLLPPQVILP